MKPQQSIPCSTAALSALTLSLAVTSSLVLTMLGGCASSAGIAPVAQVLPAQQVGLDGTEQSPGLAADWWRGFGDNALSDLIDRALAGSPGLKLAQSRVARADAALAVSQAAEGVQVNGSTDLTRERFSANSIYPPPLGGSVRTLATAQVGVSWEFDFFGRNRAAIEAAIGAQRAAQADVQAARNVLASSVARGYVQLARLIEQRAVAARSLQQRDETLTLIKQRVQGGHDTRVEQRQGEGALPETRQQIELLDEQIALARHTLAALTAQPPEALAALVPRLNNLRAPALPLVLPADLLGRRADITAARWRIEAASRDAQSAKAQFYPNINLSAFAGLASIGLDRLVKASSEQYGGGPALRLPIFDAGRLRANLRGKTADIDAAVESYNGAVIEAVHEAADQLSTLRSLARQQTEQGLAQSAAESAYELAGQRYKAGLSTYLTVLAAESNVINQRRLAVDLQARTLDTQVALVRALGGGYAGDAELPALAAAR